MTQKRFLFIGGTWNGRFEPAVAPSVHINFITNRPSIDPEANIFEAFETHNYHARIVDYCGRQGIIYVWDQLSDRDALIFISENDDLMQQAIELQKETA